jgi:hypothetical protein
MAEHGEVEDKRHPEGRRIAEAFGGEGAPRRQAFGRFWRGSAYTSDPEAPVVFVEPSTRRA